MDKISLCENCMCMTKDIKKSLVSSIIFCGKCGYAKTPKLKGIKNGK